MDDFFFLIKMAVGEGRVTRIPRQDSRASLEKIKRIGHFSEKN